MKKVLTDKQLLQFSRSDVNVEKVDTLFKKFFKMDEYHLSHKLYAGGNSTTMTREIFERGDAVVLIPYDPVNDLVVLQEQFRVGALRTEDTPWMLEFVAGMYGKNESPIDVAIREAKEEANIDITADDILPVYNFLTSPGGTTERISLFVARVDATHIGGNYGLPEEHEDILVHVVTREYAEELLANGKIVNASTLVGLQWLAMNYQKLQEKWRP